MHDVLVKVLADGMVIPVVLIGAWALLFKLPGSNRYKSYCRILLAGLTAYLLAKLIGGIYQPELQRPFELMGVQARASFLNNPGFPSDHILFCTAITLGVWFETRQKAVTALLAVCTLLVAVGRVAALVHSPLDVTGGIVIACIGALWYFMSEPLERPGKVKQWSKPRKAGKV